MNPVRQYLAAAAVGVAAFASSAYLCRLPDPGPSPLDGCRNLNPSALFLAASDYNGASNEWVAEEGDGPLIGYSLEEDSTIYNTRPCAKRGRLYPEGN